MHLEGPVRVLGAPTMALLVGVATGIATLLGGLLAIRSEDRRRLIVAFSAGAVLGVALFDLLPEALEIGGRPPSIIAAVVGASFVAYMGLDRLHQAGTGGMAHAGHLGPASLTLHSAFDGLAIGLAFHASAAVGVVVAIAVLAHDFADGVNTVKLSLLGGGGRRTASAWLVADALAPLAGIAASAVVQVSAPTLALLLATISGSFLYLGGSQLLPESRKGSSGLLAGLFTALGAFLIYATVQLAGR